MFGSLIKGSRNKRLFFSYVGDWLCVVVMVVLFFAIDLIPPFHREFSVTDTSLMHPYAEKELVPVWALVVIAIVTPIIVIGFISVGVRRSFSDFHSGVLGLALSLSMTIMITDVIKITVGRPRPDLFARCQLPAGIQNPPLQLLNFSSCQADWETYEFKDGFKSFPSGHASFSFAGLGYLSLYLAGKMHMFDKLGHTYKGFVFFFPLVGALLVAISRLHDYRHHWPDVFVGGIIGLVFAYYSYRQYYPSLSAEYSQLPYSPRIKRPKDIFPESNHHDIERAVNPGDPLYDEYVDPSNASIDSASEQASQDPRHHHERKDSKFQVADNGASSSSLAPHY